MAFVRKTTNVIIVTYTLTDSKCILAILLDTYKFIPLNKKYARCLGNDSPDVDVFPAAWILTAL